MAQTNRWRKVRETRQQGEKQDEDHRDEPGGPGQRRKEKVKTCRLRETSRRRDFFFFFFKDLRDSCFTSLSASCSSSTHYRATEPSPVPLISGPRAAQHLAVVITPDPDKQVAVTIGSESRGKIENRRLRQIRGFYADAVIKPSCSRGSSGRFLLYFCL